MLGISVYLQDLDIPYLEAAAAAGAEYVFTSLHIPEEDFSDIDEKLPQLLTTCHSLGLTLVPDVSPVTFEKLGIKNGDMAALKNLGITAVRLDYGFEEPGEVAGLQKDFQLFLNASVVTETFLTAAAEAGTDLAKIKLAHNFYPKQDTGLGTAAFQEINQGFLRRGLQVMAFVPGDRLKRFPLYQGLPTLEKHRGLHPYTAAVELMAAFGVQDVMIGDSLAHRKTLAMIARYQSEKILTLPVQLAHEAAELYDQVLDVRPDIPEKMIRLTTPRQKEIPVGKTLNRNLGTITMENRLAGRYSGEIAICRQTLPFAAESNCIGFVHPEFLPLLNWIDRQTKICFTPLADS